MRSLLIGVLILLPWILPAQEKTFPAPKWLGTGNDTGRRLQRTMALLATSTPEQRNTVRILFYGQSITEQAWSRLVADDLRRRFPNADLMIENRSIGGFSSQVLVKTAETDLYPFYPDLMIFHVYGSHIEYENIIRRTRQRTTSEILIQTDHITKDADIDEETNTAKLSPKQWNAWMNHAFLPATAERYGAELCDQHTVWKRYLRDYQLPATKLLKDSVHLNQQGEYLMAECVKACLVYRPQSGDSRAFDPMNNESVKTYRIGSDLQWVDGKLSLEFDGNRIDAVAGSESTGPLRVRIDGKKPSEIPELYRLTRTTPFPGTKWPCLLRVGSMERLQLEEWCITLKEVSHDMKQFQFDLTGSLTGPDGQGKSGSAFMSKSGRVVIDPADWNFDYATKVFKRTVTDGFKVRWKVEPAFVDDYVAPARGQSGVERTVTLAQGLPTGRHRLEIQGEGRRGIAALRVYRPPLR